MHTVSYSSPDGLQGPGGAASSQQQREDRLREKQKKYRHRQGQLVRELGELLPPGSGMRSLNQILTAAVTQVLPAVLVPRLLHSFQTRIRNSRSACRAHVSGASDGAAAGDAAGKARAEEERGNVGKGGRSLATWHADICSYRRLPFIEGLFSSRFTDSRRILGPLRPTIAFRDRHDGVPSIGRQSCTKCPPLPAALNCFTTDTYGHLTGVKVVHVPRHPVP